MIDPSKLIAELRLFMDQMKCPKLMEEISQSRRSGDRCRRWYQLDFDGRILEFWDTPGHARHHFCILII